MATQTIYDIRLRNLLVLFDQFKQGVWMDDPTAPERGMLRRFSERAGISSPIFASNLTNGSKRMGNEVARKIEEAMGLEMGWMDQDHTNDASEMSEDDLAFRDSVMAMYRQAPEASRAAVLRVLQALVLGKPIEEVVSTDKIRKRVS